PRRWLAAGVAAAAVALGFAGAVWAMGKLTAEFRPQATFAQLGFVDTVTRGADARPLANPGEPDPVIPNLWDELRYFNPSVRPPMSIDSASYALCCGLRGAPVVGSVDPFSGALSLPVVSSKCLLTTAPWV